MAALDEAYPGYGFKNHAGYGVAKHREAIERLGVTPEHRLSFAPLSRYAASGSANSETASKLAQSESMRSTTRAIGDSGEDAATSYLVRRGHTVLERNWRTKFCEIDIVSRKDDTIYFTEVKYRKNDRAGNGLAYITPKKLKQMQFAAKLFVHSNRLSETDLLLVAIAAAGDPPEVTEYIELR